MESSQIAVNSRGQIPAGDPRLDDAAAGASAAVRRHCGWHVTPVIKETLTVDGNGGTRFRLPTMNLISIDELKIRGETVDPDHYAASTTGFVELKGHRRFPRAYSSVEVTFTHGWEQAPELVSIASKIALFSLASPMGVTREQAGQVAITWGTQRGMGFSEEDLVIMDAHRLQKLP